MSETAGTVRVAGAGIGGLAAALALARHGWAVSILEQRTALAEAGAGIQIGPNGVRLLEELGIAASLAPAVAEPTAIVVRDGATARPIVELPLGAWISRRHGAPYWTTHRQDLHRALLTRAMAVPRITITSGFEVCDVTTLASHATAIAADGRTLSGAAVVAADGLWSAVRRHVAPLSGLRPIGKAAVRTVIPTASLPAGLADEATGLWLAPGAHLVHYPIRRGAETAIILVLDDATSATGTDGALRREWQREVPEGWIEAHTRSLSPLARAVLAAGRDWRRWSLHATGALPEWARGRIALLGDAAHPVLPFLAQGAVLALEDAVVLAHCLGPPGGDVARGLKSYEHKRRLRAGRVAAAAARNGRVYHLAGPAALVRDLVMRMAGGERLMAGYDWLYGWRPPRPPGSSPQSPPQSSVDTRRL